MAASSVPQQTEKVCFVTIGATAGFNDLIAAALDSEFIKALSVYGYTKLLVQYGKEGKELFEERAKSHAAQEAGVRIDGFDFRSEGLQTEMTLTKASAGRDEGVVISHAGTVVYFLPCTLHC
jgi:beta-1,4-N-acetylglucosaminyltransferase